MSEAQPANRRFPPTKINHRGPISELIGTETSYTRTIGEYDMYAFAGH